jgi:hypothetical protein
LSYNARVKRLSTKIYSILFLLVLCLLVSVPNRSLAADTSINGSDITVDLFPENPKAYTDTTITLSSYAVDINKAMIVWKNSKNVLLSGYGKTSYSFQTLGPDIGITFIVTITPAESGTPLSKNITIRPQEVDILWESVDGYTPPFYRGKSFVASEGTIKAVAIPNSSTLGSSKGQVTYAWKNGGDAAQSESGYNKDAYVFKNSNLNDSENISVTASSLDGRYNAVSKMNVPIVSPFILFYKKSPTEGTLYNQALGNETTITEAEATIVAEPYFMSLTGQGGNLEYHWQTNNQDITTPTTKNELTVAPTARGGYATISLVIENVALLFQKASASLKLNL